MTKSGNAWLNSCPGTTSSSRQPCLNKKKMLQQILKFAKIFTNELLDDLVMIYHKTIRTILPKRKASHGKVDLLEFSLVVVLLPTPWAFLFPENYRKVKHY